MLHVEAGHPQVTIVADLTRGEQLPSNTYDCILLTQTLPVLFELRAALQTVYRILKPGGVLLLTAPGISKISRYDEERWGYYWGFTSLSARKLVAECFPPERVEVSAHGNVLVAIAFLHGLAAGELTLAELHYDDPEYEVNIAVRATSHWLDDEEQRVYYGCHSGDRLFAVGGEVKTPPCQNTRASRQFCRRSTRK